MNEKERDLLKRLAPKPVPPPPQDLLRRLKEEIPERLPGNVRPFRKRVSVQVLRIAAILFVAGGALFVVSRGIRHRDLEPGAPPPVVAEAPKPEAPRPAAEPAPAPEKAVQTRASDELDAMKKQKSASRAQGFAPQMSAEKKTLQAPAPMRDEEKDAAPAISSAPAPAPPPPAAAKAESAVPKLRRDAAASNEGFLAGAAARQESGGAAVGRVAPTSGSLLGQVLGRRVAPAAASEEGRGLVLLSVGGETARLSGAGRVLSASAIPGGGLVVLAEAEDGAVVTLRSGDESVSAGASTAASPDVHLAYLAFTLERARASGDESLRLRVEREAERLAASDSRAAVLRDLARSLRVNP